MGAQQSTATRHSPTDTTLAVLLAATGDNCLWRQEGANYVVDGPFGRIEKFAEVIRRAFPTAQGALSVRCDNTDSELAEHGVPKSLAPGHLVLRGTLARTAAFQAALRRCNDDLTEARTGAGTRALVDMLTHACGPRARC